MHIMNYVVNFEIWSTIINGQTQYFNDQSKNDFYWRAYSKFSLRQGSPNVFIWTISYGLHQTKQYLSWIIEPGLCGAHKGHATFEDWAVEFEKTYSSDAELSYRKQVWEKTLIKIEKHNAELLEGKHTYGMGLNQFSDLTPEEFRMLYLTPKFDDPKPVRDVNYW